MFSSGDKVVCIDAKNWKTDKFVLKDIPIQGNIYCVKRYIVENFINSPHHDTVCLVGLDSGHIWTDGGFKASRFRKVSKAENKVEKRTGNINMRKKAGAPIKESPYNISCEIKIDWKENDEKTSVEFIAECGENRISEFKKLSGSEEVLKYIGLRLAEYGYEGEKDLLEYE